jgi:hypothetical protein
MIGVRLLDAVVSQRRQLLHVPCNTTDTYHFGQTDKSFEPTPAQLNHNRSKIS